jgi:hypothetical protein
MDLNTTTLDRSKNGAISPHQRQDIDSANKIRGEFDGAELSAKKHRYTRLKSMADVTVVRRGNFKKSDMPMMAVMQVIIFLLESPS